MKNMRNKNVTITLARGLLPALSVALCSIMPMLGAAGTANAQSMRGMSGMHDMQGMQGMHDMPDETRSKQEPPAPAPSPDAAEPPKKTIPSPSIGSMNTILPAPPRTFSLPPGHAYLPMPGMDMLDDTINHQISIDQLETVRVRGSQGIAWNVDAWFGKDINRLYGRTEGSHINGNTEDARMELGWSHAFARYWDWRLGVRDDFGDGPNRQWAAVGVQGIAPYWFDVKASAYVGPTGRTALWAQVEYDLRITQRLILTPEIEANIYGRADPARRIGSGLSDLTTSVRLRYEISRKFAPYIGVSWGRRFGQSGDLATTNGDSRVDAQVLAGVRIWF